MVRRLIIKTLPARGVDKDVLLLHAAFAVLTEFVEQELSNDTIDWRADRAHRRSRQKLGNLYYWWNCDRPFRVDPIDNVMLPEYVYEPTEHGVIQRYADPTSPEVMGWKQACKESAEMEQLREREDQSKLRRLVSLRKWMWT